MTAQQLRIDNIANNLANVSTTGFKKGRGAFEDLIYQKLPSGAPVDGAQRPAELDIGSGTRMVAMHRDFSQGNLTQTGNPYDLAVGGRGFFVVEDPDGNEFYTRDGHFGVNSEGDLVNAQGFRLSPGVNIPDDANTVAIGADGNITATFEGSTDELTLGTVRIVDVPNPAGLEALGGNLYAASPSSGDPVELYPEDGYQIQQGFLESSNVDVAEELVAMIVAQRAFELTSKVVQTADESLQVVSNMKR